VFRLALAYRLNPWPRMSKTSRRKLRHRNWPDRLSGWTLPLPSARAVGEVEPVRVFETAEAAMAFLAGIRKRPTYRGLVTKGPHLANAPSRF